VITIRLYEVMAREESAKFIAGPAVPMETRLPKQEFHGRGATQEEVLQDCINKVKIDVDNKSGNAKKVNISQRIFDSALDYVF
jgi:hypothetical protein